MNTFPKNSYQETNNKNRQAGLSPTPIVALLPNQKTDHNSFLTENQQNKNQFLFNSDYVLSKGIVNSNAVVNPKNPSEYGLYLDRNLKYIPHDIHKNYPGKVIELVKTFLS